MSDQAPAPTVIVVPPGLVGKLEEVSALIARKWGEPVEDVRRMVEAAALARGLESLREQFDPGPELIGDLMSRKISEQEGKHR